MSFRHTQAVLDLEAPKGPTRAVLLVLAIRANERGECFPSFNRIAKDAGVSRPSAIRAVEKLVKAGTLRIIGKKIMHTLGGVQAVNRYRLTLDTIPKRDHAEDHETEAEGSIRETPPHKEKVVSERSKVVSDRYKGGISLTPESSLNLQEPPILTSKASGCNNNAPLEIRDYSKIHDPAVNPLDLASTITADWSNRGRGTWQFCLEKIGQGAFRSQIATLFGEIKAGERPDNPAAVLTSRLMELVRRAS